MRRRRATWLQFAHLIGLLLAGSQRITTLNSCEPIELPRKPVCQSGILPGRWLRGEFGEGWNVYDPACQLQNFLGTASGPEKDAEKLGDEVGVLLFGDSVDRFIVRDICDTQEVGDHIWDMGVESFCLCR